MAANSKSLVLLLFYHCFIIVLLLLCYCWGMDAVPNDGYFQPAVRFSGELQLFQVRGSLLHPDGGGRSPVPVTFHRRWVVASCDSLNQRFHPIG